MMKSEEELKPNVSLDMTYESVLFYLEAILPEVGKDTLAHIARIMAESTTTVAAEAAIEANREWLIHIRRTHKLVNISQLEKEIGRLKATLNNTQSEKGKHEQL